MTKQIINTGTSANSRDGDSLRAAFTKINANFTELYTTLGIDADTDLNLGAFEFNGSVMTTTDSTAVTIDQAVTVTSDLTVGGDILPETANGGNLGSAAKPFRSLYVSNNTVFLGNVPLSLDAGTNELRINNVPISQTITYADIPSAPTIPADISDLTDTGGLLSGAPSFGNWTFNSNILSENSTDHAVIQASDFAGAKLILKTRGPTAKEWEFDQDGDLTLPEGGDILDSTGTSVLGGGGSTTELAYLELTNSTFGPEVEFTKTDYATANDVDVIEDDSTLQIGITRGENQGIYNPFTEEGWDENVSPAGTVWNIDGWDDLTDVEERTYTNFYAAYDGNLGSNVPGSRAVMYVPTIEKYYAIQWLSWTQGDAGGGFSYLRYEIDLTKLNEGISFADGTVQKTAYIPTNVKSTASGDRRIEEAVGSNTVSVTQSTTDTYTGLLNRTTVINYEIYVARTTELDEIFVAINNNEIDPSLLEISLDNGLTYNPAFLSSVRDTEYWFYYDNELGNDPVPQVEGDAVIIRVTTGAEPVVWWDKRDLPGGSSDFRGAVIDYHAYTGEATFIGTIHIVDDNGEEHITHTEVSSGSDDSENDDLWFVPTEGRISYRRIDGEAKTLKVHWTAKVFYGSEYYD